MYPEEVDQRSVERSRLFVHRAVVGASQQAKLGVWNLLSEIAGLTRTNQRVALAGKYEGRLDNLREAVGERAFAQRCEEREQHACLHLGHAALSPSQRPQEATS